MQQAPSGGRVAAQQATQRNTVQVRIPYLGTLELPPANELAFLGGIGLLAVTGLVDWPVAGVMAAGHILTTKRNNKVMHDFGAALEEV
ncbi:MAG: hypothetical protein ACTHJJ_03545 [Intrasporangium sp.]|uniref:hypothetical protein n=1 Tax=Intrasporangium sp. TaxID=1925024 RepID=UPI003F7CE0D9